MTSPSRAPCPYCPNSSKLYAVPHGLRVHIGRMHRDISASISSSLLPSSLSAPLSISGSPSCVGLEDLSSLKAKVRVLRHVPKGARCLAAGKLSSVIDRCVSSNAIEDWTRLLSFAFSALRIPDLGIKKSLTAKVKDNLAGDGLPDISGEFSPRIPPSLYQVVQAKVFEGDLRGAARVLTSECSFAPVNSDTLAALKEKHPPPSCPIRIPSAPDPASSCLTVEAEDVVCALESFHRGSASGLDGLRPEHLRELTSPSAGDNGVKLLASLTHLCNFLLEGRLNPAVCPFLYGGSLCALQKKDGGVRPIAVGSTIRRLVAKLCCRAVRSNMAAYLQPRQVGFGTPLGCEAAIHATRVFVMREGCDDVLVKLDIRNAFNCIDRSVMLEEVRALTPSIYPFVTQCYSTPSNLMFNSERILSQEGAQQGDPLGPLIFSLAIHKAISSLQAPLNLWYLDDGTIGGCPDTVERDLRQLFPALECLGLQVNTAKCEFFACSPDAAKSEARFSSLIPGIKCQSRSTLSLLGAPIFAEGVSDCLNSKTDILSSLTVHFRHLPAHVSLTLLRSCFAMPKLTYVVRTAPTWKCPDEVLRFDDLLKLALEEIVNVRLSGTQWMQASLPIRHGGLGVRRLQESGPIAFLSSAHGVANLVTHIVPNNGDIVRIPFVSEARSVWSSLCPGSDPPEKFESQRGWDDITSKSVLGQLQNLSSGVDVARLNAACKPESGAWLHALPSPHWGMLLDTDSLRVAVGLRLGCSICVPHTCVCGARVESDGYHGLSCIKCAGRRPRHHALNEILRRALVDAEIPCALEPPGLSRSDGKRPDGLTLIPWRRGRCLIWDATCVSTFAACHLAATQQVAGGGAEAAARAKRHKYASLETQYEFVPFAVETAGSWGSDAKKLVAEIGRRLREKGRDPRSGHFLAQRISLAIQRGNAAGLMGTFGRGAGNDLGHSIL